MKANLLWVALAIAAAGFVLSAAGCSSGVHLGGDDGVGYRGAIGKDGQLFSIETTAGDAECEDESDAEVAETECESEECDVDVDAEACDDGETPGAETAAYPSSACAAEEYAHIGWADDPCAAGGWISARTWAAADTDDAFADSAAAE